MTSSFLGEVFLPIQLKDRNLIKTYFEKYPHLLCGYTFTSLICLSQIFKHEWAILPEKTLLISHLINQSRHLMQPIGPFEKETQKFILTKIKSLDYPIKITEVSEDFLTKYPEFCSNFHIKRDRKMANYLYRAQDLASLEGGCYEKKRNLISQAEKNYKWILEPLTEACKPHCPKLLADIGAKPADDMSKELKIELVALKFLLDHFLDLDQKGFVICVDDKPVAFSIYEKLNSNTVVIYYEKAERQYKGSYQLINRETSRKIVEEGFEFINREEDYGIDGLRTAKMSYCPIELIPYFTLTYK